MYKQKIDNMLNKEEYLKEYNLSKEDLLRFNDYLIEQFKLGNLKKLNPVDMAETTKTDMKKAFHLFVLWAKADILKIQMYYRCKCGHFTLLGPYCTDFPATCEGCQKECYPGEDKHNVMVWFDLIEEPEHCPDLIEGRDAKSIYEMFKESIKKHPIE